MSLIPIYFQKGGWVKGQKHMDEKYFSLTGAPYTNQADVLASIPLSDRVQGLTVNINGVDYWFLADLTTLAVKYQIPLIAGSVNHVFHGNPTGEPTLSPVVEADILLSNNTTNNATTGRHGLLPILSGAVNEYLNGQGNFATPSGIANAYYTKSFNTVSSVTVTHNFGAYPIVQVLDDNNEMFIPLKIDHTGYNEFVVTFTASRTGTVVASLGSPQLIQLLKATNDYTTTIDDYFVELNAAGKTITLHAASALPNQRITVTNTSTGYINVYGNINGSVITQPLAGGSGIIGNSLSLYSNGTTWIAY